MGICNKGGFDGNDFLRIMERSLTRKENTSPLACDELALNHAGRCFNTRVVIVIHFSLSVKQYAQAETCPGRALKLPDRCPHPDCQAADSLVRWGTYHRWACTGAEAFGRYGQAVAPLLESRGAGSIWQGRQAAMLIGPQDKDWHLAVLVRYPSAKAFLDMATSEEYLAIMAHRTAALEDSRLIAFHEL